LRKAPREDLLKEFNEVKLFIVEEMRTIGAENDKHRHKDAGILSYGLVENHITTRLLRVLK